MSIDLNARIPNNVNLADDRRLQRALESWQPSFIDWWQELGPEGSIRITTSICAPRLASRLRAGPISAHVKMPEYRWGIFVAPPVEGRTIPFGEHIRASRCGMKYRVNTGHLCGV